VTFHALALEARDALEDAGISRITAAFDVEILARHILGWDRAAWLARRGETASDEFRRAYSALISRRATREPVAYIRGVQEFWGREFEVGPAVLIPRPETELLIEVAEPFLRDRPNLSVVDLGTGSGCIAVTLALEHANAIVFATDISSDALDVARRNAIRLGAPRVKFRHGDLVADVDVPLDVIVTNPPYVARTDRPGLAPEVRDYEPDTALFGSDDGLGVMQSILEVSRSALRPNGHLITEIGYGQDDRVQHLASRFPEFVLEAMIEDLQRIPRVMVLRRLAVDH
jgi:release factor glutamine methyltransferase